MNRLKKKLKNQTGASITFALLLFLVCAVLSSVIIVAATAASGRMSKIAESDQRYYAVTSAAELLQNLFKNPHDKVSIVMIENSWTNTTYIDGMKTSSAPAPVPSDETYIAVYIVPDKKADEITEDYYITDYLLMENDDIKTTYKNDTIQKDAAVNVYNGNELDKDDGKDRLSLTSSGSGSDNSLAVKISEELDLNGNIKLTLYNKYKTDTNESDAGSRYTIVLSFDADKNKTQSTITEIVSETSVDDSTYIETTKDTKTTITTLIWSLADIKTSA